MTREEAVGVIERLPVMSYMKKNEKQTIITTALDMAIEALKEPERRKGYWEDFDCGNSYRCTSCGEIWTLNDGTPAENNMNYCPKCGADMRGEQE